MVRNIHSSSRRKQRKAFRSRAWLNGVEVTNLCFYADDRRGIVRLYKAGGAGSILIDHRTGEAATEELRGRVVIGRRLEVAR